MPENRQWEKGGDIVIVVVFAHIRTMTLENYKSASMAATVLFVLQSFNESTSLMCLHNVIHLTIVTNYSSHRLPTLLSWPLFTGGRS